MITNVTVTDENGTDYTPWFRDWFWSEGFDGLTVETDWMGTRSLTRKDPGFHWDNEVKSDSYPSIGELVELWMKANPDVQANYDLVNGESTYVLAVRDSDGIHISSLAIDEKTANLDETLSFLGLTLTIEEAPDPVEAEDPPMYEPAIHGKTVMFEKAADTQPFEIAAGPSGSGVPSIYITTDEMAGGKLRVVLNDAVIFAGDPEGGA